MTLRPCVSLLRGGPDRLDVYTEELTRLDKLGIQWTAVDTLWDDSGEQRFPENAIGGIIHVDGVLKPVVMLCFTDEPE